MDHRSYGRHVSALGPFIRRLLDAGPFPCKSAVAYRLVITAGVLIATAIEVVRTVSGIEFGHTTTASAAEFAAQLVLTVDLFIQASGAVNDRRADQTPQQALRSYLASAYGLIDILAVVPFFVELAWPQEGDLETALGVLRFLKLARFSPALETLGAVVRREARALQAAAFTMALLMLGTATALYLVERHANSGFASIPEAMWWSVATLSTVGYGDVVPVTPLGRLLGGICALLGVCMFALPASIMATGFAEEIKRRDFLATWNMVAKVPFLNGLDAAQIASITALLRYSAAAPGDVLIRAGDMGDRMYFIISGQVAVDFGGSKPAALADGDFFGEIALLHRSPRTATVTARSRCQLLILDVKDFRRFVAGSPRIAEVIARTAEQRLQAQAEPVAAEPVD
jgi:voltage-gated potassium channel